MLFQNKKSQYNVRYLAGGGKFINEFVLPLIDWLRSEHHEPKNEIEEKTFEEEAVNLENYLMQWIPSSIKVENIASIGILLSKQCFKTSSVISSVTSSPRSFPYAFIFSVLLLIISNL